MTLPSKTVEDRAAQKNFEWLYREVTAITGPFPPSGPAGGVLSGTYPDPGFAVDMATQAELNAAVASAVNDGDAAGGVLSGTYPNPGFAVDMATQAELDAAISGLTLAGDVTGAIGSTIADKSTSADGFRITPSGITSGSADTVGFQIDAGNSAGSTIHTQIALAHSDSPYRYRHTISTRHDTSADNKNAIDFRVWSIGQAATALGNDHVMSLYHGFVGIGGITEPTVSLDVGGAAKIRQRAEMWSYLDLQDTSPGGAPPADFGRIYMRDVVGVTRPWFWGPDGHHVKFLLAGDAIETGGAAGGVLSGTYPNPGFAVDMATQAELDTHAADTTAVHGIADTADILLRTLVDAKGDLLVASAADTVTRIAAGADGHVLTVDSTQATGVKWAAAAGGGGTLPVSDTDVRIDRDAVGVVGIRNFGDTAYANLKLLDLHVTGDLTLDDDVTLAAGSVLTWAGPITLYANGTVLQTDNTIRSERGTAAAFGFTTRLTGDTDVRGVMTAGGSLIFGDGATVANRTMIKYESAGVLAIRNQGDTAYEDLKLDALVAATSLTTGTATATIGSGPGTFLNASGQIHAARANATDVAYLAWASAHTVAPFVVRADGQIQWGDGAAARSVALGYGGADILLTPDRFRVNRTNTTDVALDSLVGAETATRFYLRADGQLAWGGGSGVQDTILSHPAANQLQLDTDDAFLLGSGAGTGGSFLQMFEQSADPAAPAANGMRLYSKDNGAGKTALYVRFPSGAEQQIAVEA